LLDELETYFISCEEQGLTFQEVLLQNSTLLRARQIASRNRRLRINEVAQHLELEIESRDDIISKTIEDRITPQLAKIWKETEIFTYKINRQNIQFYSDTACISLCKGDVIVHRMSYQGPILILGPENTSTSHRSNRSWSSKNTTVAHSSGAFISRYLQVPAVGDIKYNDLATNVFIGSERFDSTKKIATQTKEIAEIEKMLGRDLETFPRQIEFQPILVIV